MVLKKYGRKVWDKEIQCNKHNLLNEIHNYGETGRDTQAAYTYNVDM